MWRRRPQRPAWLESHRHHGSGPVTMCDTKRSCARQVQEQQQSAGQAAAAEASGGSCNTCSGLSGLTVNAGGMMTGLGEPVTVDATPAASARLVSRGEGVAPSTRNPTTLTGGLALLWASPFFILRALEEAAPGSALQRASTSDHRSRRQCDFCTLAASAWSGPSDVLSCWASEGSQP